MLVKDQVRCVNFTRTFLLANGPTSYLAPTYILSESRAYVWTSDLGPSQKKKFRTGARQLTNNYMYTTERDLITVIGNSSAMYISK